MIAGRDFVVAIVSIFATAAIMTFAQTAAKPVMHSCVFHWSSLNTAQTRFGERRGVFDAPTATLENFECHITTLDPGESPHAAHQHPDEELMIVKEGTLEAVQNGVTNRVEAGGIIFCAANERHGLRNIGGNRATYFVLRIRPHTAGKHDAK